MKEIKDQQLYRNELKQGNLTLFSRLDDLMLPKINSDSKIMIIKAFKDKGICDIDVIDRY